MQETNIPSAIGSIAVAIHHADGDTLAILCPGYLDSKDYLHLVVLANDLQKRGVTAVRFDPTGTWASSGVIAEYTNTQYLSDIHDVLEYTMRGRQYKNILVGGHSRGGQMAILFASTEPRVTHVLGIMPSTGKRLSAEKRYDWETAGVSISTRDVPNSPGEMITFAVPFSHVIDRERYDVFDTASRSTRSVAYIAGSEDILIPPEEVRALYSASNEPKLFEVLDGIGHDYRKHAPQIAMVNECSVRMLTTLGFLG